eukprot:TRINITY_DN6368_c0_g1_i1.p1 TRINITY_DN6368_c0_g1~~TRINITY_DN6368_c0_g1_i1.p1  ORF type:complete len:324 (-),score=55.71 TRINITY_DN6368_c0_g1_i1:583-1554(-)
MRSPSTFQAKAMIRRGSRYGGRFVTSLATAGGATVLLMWLSGILNDEVEMSIFWDIVWLIPGNTLALYALFTFPKRLTKELEKGMPVWICLRNVIRASFANIPLMSALMFTIVATVCCYSLLLGHHTAEWLQILCINATFWSIAIIVTMATCMGLRHRDIGQELGNVLDAYPFLIYLVTLITSLAIGSQLPYGPAIKIIATVTNFSGFQSIAWYFYELLLNTCPPDRAELPGDLKAQAGPDIDRRCIGKENMKEVEHMTPREVAELLRSKGYVDYADTFQKHQVKGQHLARLSAPDLEKMGVSIVGHQMDLLALFSRAYIQMD